MAAKKLIAELVGLGLSRAEARRRSRSPLAAEGVLSAFSV
jgi:hypothetical protein